jgi:Fe-S cluster assembly protein SufD
MQSMIEVEKDLHIILKKDDPNGNHLFFVNKNNEIDKNNSEHPVNITLVLREGVKANIVVLNHSETKKLHFHIALTEPHSKAEFKALMMPKQSERMEISLCMEHQAPDCESNTLCRGVVKDKAQTFFTGKIIVKENAQNSIAKLENKNLLLSNEAFCHTEPQLEIYNDEVKCSHGATVGHLDLDALFYLRSRGLSLEEAEEFMIQAFIAPILMDSRLHGNDEGDSLIQNFLLEEMNMEMA